MSLGTMILTVEPGRGGRGHLSLGTMILTVEPGRGGEGSFVSIGTMILTVEAGKGGDGSFVSRNNDSNCRTRERWGGVICL